MRPVPGREQCPCPGCEMMGLCTGVEENEEFRINPRFQIWVMGKMVRSSKYKWKTVRLDCLGVSKPSNMAMCAACEEPAADPLGNSEMWGYG